MSGFDEPIEPSAGGDAELGESLSEEDLEALRAYEESLSAEGEPETTPGGAPVPGEDLAAVTAQRDEYLDALRRLQAEFDNYRKRTVRQQTEILDRAAEGLLERLLPVLDALDLATSHHGGDPGEDVGALQQIAALLRDVLQKDGLSRLGAVGDSFDPTVHEAVLHVPAEDPGEGADDASAGGAIVEEVLRPGYEVRGRVIRPAMVKVRG